jgi:hypothetical protein
MPDDSTARALTHAIPDPVTPNVSGPASLPRPVGRPSKYNPEFCELVVKLGESGASRAVMAATIGIDRMTMRTWEKEEPAFLAATTRALELSQAWWEHQGQRGIWSRDFNANAYRLQVMNRFPAEWRERSEIEHRLPDGPVVAIYLPDNGRDVEPEP